MSFCIILRLRSISIIKNVFCKVFRYNIFGNCMDLKKGVIDSMNNNGFKLEVNDF